MTGLVSVSEPAAENDVVQLSVFDNIPVEVLDGPGTALRDFFTPGRVYDVRAGESSTLRRLPSAGWRLLKRTEHHGHRSEQIAAPYPGEEGAWSLISMSEREGRWIVSSNPWPQRPVPTKPVRRQHLQLRLLDSMTPAGTPPVIRPTLTNTGTALWRNVAEDTPTVLVWVLDPDGTPIMTPGLMVFGSSGVLPDIEPGTTITLYAADMKTPEVHTYPPGTYQLLGVLDSLQLRSEPGTLHISEPTAGPPV